MRCRLIDVGGADWFLGRIFDRDDGGQRVRSVLKEAFEFGHDLACEVLDLQRGQVGALVLQRLSQSLGNGLIPQVLEDVRAPIGLGTTISYRVDRVDGFDWSGVGVAARSEDADDGGDTGDPDAGGDTPKAPIAHDGVEAMN